VTRRDVRTAHIAVVGFMGAGKTTLGRELARRIERPFIDVDAELERRHGLRIEEMFAQNGEPWFRVEEERLTVELLDAPDLAVLALGGGAVTTPATREALARRAVTIWIRIDRDEAWRRVERSRRPLARDPERFRALYDERLPLYEETATFAAQGVDDALLSLAGVVVERGAHARLSELVPGEGPVALIADENVLQLHPPILGARLASTHTVPSGEAAKELAVCERLWDELRLDRGGTVVALGGGTTTDVAGFVAAAYLRGVAWAPVPTTLVGQVDAAIGGKTGIDLGRGKNLVGAFHEPEAVVIDPDLLGTLPAAQRLEGLAEVVKTGLLAGREVWRLPDEQMVSVCAAFKASVCLADPQERGRREILNLGHTFAHGLEAAGGYAGPTHGQAVALGLRAALRLSVRHLGLAPAVLAEVERILPVDLARVSAERAWQAMAHDKKVRDGRLRLVLVRAPGEPLFGVELPHVEIREALEGLIAT
jgi:shikimate kinase/3-dehydroquinate synthase